MLVFRRSGRLLILATIVVSATMGASPADASPRHCRIHKTTAAVIGECRYPELRLAVVMYSNKDYYMCQWNGKPHGMGLLKDLQDDPNRHRTMAGRITI